MQPPAERAAAARNVTAVTEQNRTIDWAIERRSQSGLSQELTYGTLRHYFSLRDRVDGCLAKPFRTKDQDLYNLLLVGAYQLEHTRIPTHAAIYETVAAVRALRKPWAKGVVNAVLRKLADAGPGYDQGQTPEQSFDHPAWLASKLEDQYPEPARLMRANNERAPMSLRVNRRRTSPEAYRAVLDEGAIDHRASWLPESLVLTEPRPVDELPGYAEGLVSVQDIGAQLAIQPLLAGIQPGQRVLDACAAPGGKLTHMLEAVDGLQITALDRSAERLHEVKRLANRLGLVSGDELSFADADATELSWWDEVPYDHVLLDAPCSGTGTLRRHPDIKLLRRWPDVENQVALQRRLLANLWRTLRSGGTLLYCTCSILAEENDGIVGAFVNDQADAGLAAIELPTGNATAHGWQLLPIEPTTDGFYVALLIKDAHPPGHQA